MSRRPRRRRIALAAGLAAGVAALYWTLFHTGVVASFSDRAALAGLIERLGRWGPVTVVLLMVAAVLVGVVPTAPISLAAGAAYGNVWGTLYIVLGSGSGAVLAFLIARYLAYGAVRRRDWANRHLDEERSQAALMLTVFLLRVVPFIHLDPISYVAGLTPLRLWRFAVATFAGIAPMSFVLVTLGDRVAASDMDPRLAIGLLVAGLVLLPAALKLIWTRRRSRVAS